MTIQEQIQDIIQRRRERLPAIDAKLATLDRLMEQAQRMEITRDGIFAPDGSVLPDSPYAPMLTSHPDMVWEMQAMEFGGVKGAVEKARRALQAYRARCARKTVNISVVGRARIGKSAFLKSISGLSDQVIPAFDSSDCTGAPSVITNVPGSPLKAHLTFKSREDMRRLAQAYLEELIPDVSKRPMLQSAEQIRSLDLNAIRAAMPDLFTASHLLEYLEKLVMNCDGENGWLAYAGAEPLDLYDEDQIVTFVAQNNGRGLYDPERKNYYKYLAVDTCEISCSFPQRDLGSISLIDTVGLGDRAEGIQESMLKTVAERSDAVVLFFLPSGAGSGIDESLVKDLYTPIANACAGRNLDSWLFWFANQVNPKPADWPEDRHYPADNVDVCRSAVSKLKTYHWAGVESAKNISALDARAVQEEFLLPMLQSVAQNLDGIDQIYRDDVETALRELQAAYGSLCSRAQKVLRTDIRANAKLVPLIHELTEDALTRLRSGLYQLNQQWRMKRDEPCVSLNRNIQHIFNRMRDQSGEGIYLPTKDQVLNDLMSGEQPSNLYVRYANSIRNQISRDFLDVDLVLSREIEAMKNSLAAVLYENCDLVKLCPLPGEDRPAWTWLNDFAENILDEEYPVIRLAVDTAAQFSFSVKGFLTYEVRQCLDSIDMTFRGAPSLASGGPLGKTAVSIFTALHVNLVNIAGNLEEAMKQLSIKPNRAMYAEVADFCDRIFYTEGVEMEWRNFFADRANQLWADALKKQQAESVLFRQWIDLVQDLQDYNTAASFRL